MRYAGARRSRSCARSAPFASPPALFLVLRLSTLYSRASLPHTSLFLRYKDFTTLCPRYEVGCASSYNQVGARADITQPRLLYHLLCLFPHSLASLFNNAEIDREMKASDANLECGFFAAGRASSLSSPSHPSSLSCAAHRPPSRGRCQPTQRSAR